MSTEAHAEPAADHAPAQDPAPKASSALEPKTAKGKQSLTPAPAPEPIPAPDALDQIIEAVVLSLDRPLSAGKISEALRFDPALGPAAIRDAVARLNAAYTTSGRSFRIEAVAGGFRLMTLPAFAQPLARFHESRADSRISRAAVETLAIIAYKQPITRAQLEAIRGVACGEVLRSLLERRLITIAGRAEELGRPILYGTTKAFLDAFGLASIKDLPTVGELKPAAASE